MLVTFLKQRFLFNSAVTDVGSVKRIFPVDLFHCIVRIALSSLDNKPQALTEHAMIRAKMCEKIGKKLTHSEKADEFFTAGLLSLIDAFFDLPIDDLIGKLGLKENIKRALINREGLIGSVLNYVCQYQQANHTSCIEVEKTLSVSRQEINKIYLESIKWATENNLTSHQN